MVQHLFEIQTKPLLLALFITGLGVFIYKYVTRRKYRLPPSPFSLPLFGNAYQLLTMKQQAYVYFASISQALGPVIRIDLGPKSVVILNDGESVREAFLKQENQIVFAGRPKMFSFVAAGYTDSISMSNYSPIWNAQRKLAHEAFRHFASSKQLQEKVAESCSKIFKVLKGEAGAFDPGRHLMLVVYNIILNICFSVNYDIDDAEFNNLVDADREAIEAFGAGFYQDALPVSLARLLPLGQRLSKVTEIVKHFYSYVRERYEEHYKCFDASDPKDILDHLLLKEKELKKDVGHEKTDIMHQLTDRHLTMVILDIFGAGIETTSFTIVWIIKFLTKHSMIQEHIQKLIDEHIGVRMPTVNDKNKLPYVEAFIMEVIRMSTIAPFGVPHVTLDDAVINGFDIPKGTMVAVNHYALHQNENDFSNPHEFKPERFLSEEGTLIVEPDSYLPFSIGRRMCLGKAIAKNELFLVLCTLCQKLKFAVPEGEVYDMDAEPGAFGRLCKPYKVIVTERK